LENVFACRIARALPVRPLTLNEKAMHLRTSAAMLARSTSCHKHDFFGM
jgi:hypothetical protein